MLQIELAAVVDAGEPLVNATNVLKGNGALDFDCQKVLFSLLASTQTYMGCVQRVRIKCNS